MADDLENVIFFFFASTSSPADRSVMTSGAEETEKKKKVALRAAVTFRAVNIRCDSGRIRRVKTFSHQSEGSSKYQNKP